MFKVFQGSHPSGEMSGVKKSTSYLYLWESGAVPRLILLLLLLLSELTVPAPPLTSNSPPPHTHTHMHTTHTQHHPISFSSSHPLLPISLLFLSSFLLQTHTHILSPFLTTYNSAWPFNTHFCLRHPETRALSFLDHTSYFAFPSFFFFLWVCAQAHKQL